MLNLICRILAISKSVYKSEFLQKSIKNKINSRLGIKINRNKLIVLIQMNLNKFSFENVERKKSLISNEVKFHQANDTAIIYDTFR